MLLKSRTNNNIAGGTTIRGRSVFNTEHTLAQTCSGGMTRYPAGSCLYGTPTDTERVFIGWRSSKVGRGGVCQ